MRDACLRMHVACARVRLLAYRLQYTEGIFSSAPHNRLQMLPSQYPLPSQYLLPVSFAFERGLRIGGLSH